MQGLRWIWPGAMVAVMLVGAVWPGKSDKPGPRLVRTDHGAEDAPLAGSAVSQVTITSTPAAETPAATPVAATLSALGNTIPDGSYQCSTWSGSNYISLGTIRSVNNSLDTELLAKVGATYTGATPTPDGITVSYTSARGYRETMDCKRQ